MSGLTGLVGGVAGLALLDAVVSTEGAAHVGGLFAGVADALAYWLDPAQPLLPNRHGCGTSSATIIPLPGAAPEDAPSAEEDPAAPALGDGSGGLLGDAGDALLSARQRIVPQSPQPAILT